MGTILRLLVFIPMCAVIASSSGEPLKKASDQLPPDELWVCTIFGGTGPLDNVPKVLSRRTVGNDIFVKIKNTGSTTLQYYSVGSHHIQLFQEVDIFGRWEMACWDICGMGKETFFLEPEQTVELRVRFWDSNNRERMLGHFTEQGSWCAGMVVLATEP